MWPIHATFRNFWGGNNIMKRLSIIGPLLLATILGLGFFIIAWIAFIPRVQLSGFMGYFFFTVGGDGSVVITEEDYDGITENIVAKFPVPKNFDADSAKTESDDSQKYFLNISSQSRSKETTSLSWNKSLRITGANPESPEAWYLIYEDDSGRLGYMVGYNLADSSLIGYFGKDRFYKTIPPIESRIPVLDTNNPMIGCVGVLDRGVINIKLKDIINFQVLIGSSEGIVYRVDFKKRSIAKCVELPGLKNLLVKSSAERFFIQERDFTLDSFIAQTEDSLKFLSYDGQLLRSIPFCEENDKSYEMWGWKKGGALIVGNGYTGDEKTGFAKKITLTWINRNGEIVGDEKLSYPTVIAPMTIPDNLIMASVGGGCGPCIGFVLDRFFGKRYFSQSNLAIISAIVVALLLALVAVRRQRRLGEVWWVWGLFVLVFGVPGFVGYIFCRPWPVWVRCPSCKKKVTRHQEACLACGHQFDKPEPLGTDIFDLPKTV
jgi:hypothetical protein